MGKGKRIPGHKPIKREKGFLYFLDKQGYPAKVKMARGRKRKK